MDTAFGAANVVTDNTFNVGLLAGASFVYLEGGSLDANALNSFISANTTTLENFVSGGGRLLINAAPNQGGSFSLGFGETLNFSYPSYSTASYTGTVNAAGVAAGLTNGGIATNYRANYFAHATLTGPATSLIDGSNGSVFASETYGSGLVAFGGQTDIGAYAPHLLLNELTYVSAAPVPEPETYAIMLVGLGLIGLMAPRNKSV
jgi:hypothetical protein